MRPWLSTFTVVFAFGASPLAGQTLEDYDYENLGLRGIGVYYGYLRPNKVDATPSYGLRLDLGYLGPGVRIVPSFAYWKSELKRAELERLSDNLRELDANVTADSLGPIEWSAISAGIEGHLVFTTPLDVLTYVGVGGSVHALNGTGGVIDDTFIEDLLDSFTIGVTGLAGLEFEPVPGLWLFGEVRYTVLNDIRYPGIRAGAALLFSGGRAPATERVGPRR